MFRFVIPPVLVLALAGGMLLADRMVASPEVVKPPLTWLGILGVLGGWGMAQWHARLFRSLQVNIQTFGKPTGLCERGLFSRTRNPMYLGMLLLLLGIAWWLGSSVAWVGPLLFFAAAQFWYIPFEEAQLELKYGERYEHYRRRVPRWIGIRGWGARGRG